MADLFDKYKQKLTELQKEKQNAVSIITNNKDLVVFEELNSKFNLQNDKIGLEVSKIWQGVNNIEENTSSKIELLNDKILLESERATVGNLIVNGAFESGDTFGWNVGGENISVTQNFAYEGKRDLNYINVTPTSLGNAAWSNRFYVEPSTEYTVSGLFFTGLNTRLGIRVKFSNTITKVNDFEKDGTFDKQLDLGNWVSEYDSFIYKNFTFIVPPTAKTAFLEFYYYETTNYCGWTEIMLTKGKQPASYVSKTASYSKVFQKLTPDSIVSSVNKGLAEGNQISVASTILDANGFSQLNDGKLSVRLNNNGTHVYSFLRDGKINGSLQALKNVVTGDDVVGLTNEKGAYAQIAYRGDGSNYYNYIRFDKEGLTQPTPITVYEEFDMNGLNMFFDKKNQESRIFGYLDSKNRGSVALYTNNFGFWSNDGSGHHLLTLDRDVANFYNRVIIGGDLSVIGNKNCIQQTKFGDVPFYANEDINSLLTETDTDSIYTTELVEDKYICRVEIDELIQECINTELPYNVYIDKLSWGDYKVEIREKNYFIVESDRVLKFKYKLEGKRKGFEKENKINNFMNNSNIKKPLVNTAPTTEEYEQKPLHEKRLKDYYKLYCCNKNL